MYFKPKYLLVLFILGSFGIINAAYLKLNGNPNYGIAMGAALALYWFSVMIFLVQKRKEIKKLFKK